MYIDFDISLAQLSSLASNKAVNFVQPSSRGPPCMARPYMTHPCTVLRWLVFGLVVFELGLQADGFNVHGAVDGLTLQNAHIENSGDDCMGVWGSTFTKV